MRIVVADTGPLIALARVGRLELLEELFGEVAIPDAVFHELRIDEDRPGSTVLRNALRASQRGFRRHVAGEVPAALAALLDPGESEALVLAERLGAVLLIDERRGRVLARKRGLAFLGTGGLLLAAKRAGELPRVRPVVEDLSSTGYRMSEPLVSEILARAGEADSPQ